MLNPNELRLLAIVAMKYIDLAHTLKAMPNLSPEESRDISDCIVKAQTEAAEMAKAEAQAASEKKKLETESHLKE